MEHKKQIKKNLPAKDKHKTISEPWICSICDEEITDLPAETLDTDDLICKECYKKQTESH